MSKTIRLNEGPLHNEEIKVAKVANPGEHFVHDGFLYRQIDGAYAQCCGRAADDTKPAKAPTKAAAKAPAKKKPTAPAATT